MWEEHRPEMNSAVAEWLLILLLILLNGFLAMSEIAIVAARRARLEERANGGDHKSAAALELSRSPSHFLSAVQVGITLISIAVGAVGSGRSVAALSGLLQQVGLSALLSQSVALAAILVLITFLTVVFGELVPKRLALADPERVAAAAAIPMRTLARVAKPIVSLLSASTKTVIRILGVHPSLDPPVTDEEVSILLAEGTQAGVFEEVEQDMVERVLLLDDRRVNALMTPRPEIQWLNVEDPPEVIRQQLVESSYSRFPVARASLDQLLGEVRAKDVFLALECNTPLDLSEHLREPLFVPEIMPVLKVLETLKSAGTEMALVLDEYGNLEGLITLRDILEAIVGDIPSDDEDRDAEAVLRDDGSWLVDGLLPTDELKEIIEVVDLPGEAEGLYQTVAGFMIARLGRFPSASEHFACRGWRFEVMDMDGHRVDKVLVSREPETDDRASASPSDPEIDF